MELACDKSYDNTVNMELERADEWACDEGGSAKLIGSLEVVRLRKRKLKGKYKYKPLTQQQQPAPAGKSDNTCSSQLTHCATSGENEEGDKENKVPGERMGEKMEPEVEGKGENEKEPVKWWERGKSKISLPKSKTTYRKRSKNRHTAQFSGKISNKITNYFHQEGGRGGAGVTEEKVGVLENGVVVCTAGGLTGKVCGKSGETETS